MLELLNQIIANPVASLAIVANLILIESLLSVDNAAVLATMVMDLPDSQRDKALKYGIFGAYLFRGLAMLFASLLLKIWWLSPLGGLYLLYLVYSWWKGKQTETTEDDFVDKNNNWFYKLTIGTLGTFWATVGMIEIMDMAFSIDNIFAAVAFTDNIILICLGVFIGILAMRFVAQLFVKLMKKYPFLETSAFIVIAILGLKLVLGVSEHFFPESMFAALLKNEWTDIAMSITTVSIFFVPILTNILFGIPKKTEE